MTTCYIACKAVRAVYRTDSNYTGYRSTFIDISAHHSFNTSTLTQPQTRGIMKPADVYFTGNAKCRLHILRVKPYETRAFMFAETDYVAPRPRAYIK